MNKSFYKYWLDKQMLLILFMFTFLLGDQSWSLSLEKKYQLSICSLFKNEAPFLKEWIEYHRMVGVEHFYLYNNGSTDRYLSVLAPYIKQNIVTLIQWNDRFPEKEGDFPHIWALSTQVIAYEHALKVVTPQETKWLAFLEVNDFLVPSDVDNLQDILNYYDDYSGINLLENYFDTSDLESNDKRLLIENLEFALAPAKIPEKSFCKMIVKPELCYAFAWFPYRCLFKHRDEATVLSKSELRINHYCKYANYVCMQGEKTPLYLDYRSLGEKEIEQLLVSNYQIEDQERLIYRFMPELRKRMGLDLGWYVKRG